MKSKSLAVIIAVVVLLSTAFGPPHVSAQTPNVTFSISDGVSHSDEMYVREGVALAIAFLEDRYDARFSDKIAVNVRTTANPTDPGIVAFAGGDFLVVFTGAPIWDYLSPALRLHVIIHEFVHIYQYDTIGNDEASSPMWFIEGMAEFVSFEAVERLGVLSGDDIYDDQTWELAGADDVPELGDLEDIADYQSAALTHPIYPQSYLAVSRLAGNRGAARIVEYLDLIAGGDAWPVAFEEAFGMTPDKFYMQFRKWQINEMLAPAHQPVAFRAVDPHGIDADVDIIDAPSTAGTEDQIVVIAQTEPNAKCQFELSDADGSSVDEIESIASATGVVYWLETIPVDVLGGQASIAIDCGGATEEVEISIAS